MEAELGHNPSYVWLSLLAARDIIREGHNGRRGMAEELKWQLING